MSMILVRHKDPAHRGGLFGGADGTTVYWVSPQTGYLHLTRGNAAAPKPGCHPQDAAEFAKFPATFEVEKSKAPPAPPPPAPAEIRVDAAAEEPEDGEEEPVEEEPEAPASELPKANATKATWVKWAEDHEVELDSAEIEILKKGELIEVIEERYRLLQEG